MVTLVAVGLIAWLLGRDLSPRGRLVFYAAAGAVTALAGAARVVLDAHWLSDVVAGLAVGLLWLCGVVAVASRPAATGAPPLTPVVSKMTSRLAGALALVVPLAVACASAPPGLACPPGTEATSTPTPSGREQWCRRPDGRRHGPYVAWHARGRKQAEGAFAEGHEHGVWTRWFANGRPLASGTYAAGVKHGRWRFWHSTGAPQEAGEFRDGREQGVWTRWFENGRTLSEGDYEDGVPAGPWTFWYESGRVKETGEYRDGLRHGRWRGWSVNGQPCDVEAGSPVSPAPDRQVRYPADGLS